MDTTDGIPRDFQWEMMSDMERCVWATAFALTLPDTDSALTAADLSVRQLREIEGGRSPRLAVEIEAALSGVGIERGEFDTWYRVAKRIRLGAGREPEPLTDAECEIAFENYRRAEFY